MIENKYILLQEATRCCNYSQEYLSLRARQGKLKSVKFGKNWFTTREWLEEYVEKTEQYNEIYNNSRARKKTSLSAEPVLKKENAIPFNLPIEKKPILRFGFVAALLFVLIIATGVFAKESFLNVFRKIPLFVQEFSQGFDRGLTKEIQNLYIRRGFSGQAESLSAKGQAGKIQNLASRANEYTYTFLSTIGDVLIEEITKSFTQSFAGITEGIKIFFSVEYQTADVGDAFKEYGQWIASNLKSGYFAADDFMGEKVSQVGKEVNDLIPNINH